MNIRGIYLIRNKINNKKYIGESLNIKRRWEEHTESLNNNKHHSYKLQEDWNTYGKDNFEFKILSVLEDRIKKFTDKHVLIIYEHLYINKYNTINDGYNVENTLQKITNGEKCLFEKDCDKNVFEEYRQMVLKGKFIECDGLILKNSFNKYDLTDKLHIDFKTFKNLMIVNNIIINTESKESSQIKRRCKYNSRLNKNIIKEEHILKDEFPNIKIDKVAFDNIYEILKDYIKTGIIKTTNQENNQVINIKEITYNTKTSKKEVEDFDDWLGKVMGF